MRLFDRDAKVNYVYVISQNNGHYLTLKKYKLVRDFTQLRVHIN